MPPAQPRAAFPKLETELNFPAEERATLALWKTARIFEKTLAQTADGPSFVFYEGPPTANGLPHNGHVLTRVIKDLFPRYKTMKGFHVPRKAGWDTHGLPVEVEVEKELHIHGKAAIDAYGMEPFVQKCIQSVFRYTDEWERLTERVAFWVDLKDAYVTYHRSYVESAWWAISELYKKGLLYRGHKVVWWWAQGGTALSAGEVGQGYKTVDDPSVYVAFPLKSEPDLALLVWTTTPWTLPSNSFAAVNPAFDYAVVSGCAGLRLVVAKDLVPKLAEKLKAELTVERVVKGAELVGLEYLPPFDLFANGLSGQTVQAKDGRELAPYFRVLAADFVLLDQTGIVHIAPAFGEDDFAVYRRELASLKDPEALPLLCAVESDGTFKADVPRYAGRWVKECDKDIQHELKERGLLVHAEQFRHEYPFCWRADDDPLIQLARPAWYIRTTALIDKAIANNQKVQWFPEHIKDGRFGDFLDNNVDWALSRERYWGTPLNVWVCEKDPAHEQAPDSVAAILAMNPHAFDHFDQARAKDPSLNEHLIVHKPWIDAVTFPCAAAGCGGTMRRVPEVLDCWFDSGCMPFAQWGFPHTGHAEFKRSFPADFISEGIDQTRGWFYSLLMVSTLIFDEETQARFGLAPVAYPFPYRTCMVLGHVGDKDGKKESKSKGNYTPPEVILDAVKMDFAVLDAASAGSSEKVEKGVALIAREDLEGLDLTEGAKVLLAPVALEEATPRPFVVKVGKKMRRRTLVLHEDDRAALGVRSTQNPMVKPVELPRLPEDERVTLEDPASPAPGADAFRWFFFASNPPWSTTRHSLANVRLLQKEFLIKLRNVFSFFTIYANIDAFEPAAGGGQGASGEALGELDRWILSELALLVQGVGSDLDAFDVYAATQKLTAFVDALSNWYVRRSRDRFWRGGFDADKAHAYQTLYQVLVVTSRVIAPFVPFLAEKLHQHLVLAPARAAGRDVKESVHLEAFPAPDLAAIDRDLSLRMRAVRDIVSVGLKVRTVHKLKVRQPLRKAHVVLNQVGLARALEPYRPMIAEELNVLAVDFVSHEEAAPFGKYTYKPNFRTLGQRGLGKEAQALKKAWGALSPEDRQTLDAILQSGAGSFHGTSLVREDIEAAFESSAGFAAAGDRVGVVVLETTLDDELRDLGFAREVQSRIQAARKEAGLEYTDRITVTVTGSPRVKRVIDAQKAEIARECLATSVTATEGPPDAQAKSHDVEGEPITLSVTRT